MTTNQKPQLLLLPGDPPKATYGSSVTIELVRFYLHLKIIEEANEKFFNPLCIPQAPPKDT